MSYYYKYKEYKNKYLELKNNYNLNKNKKFSIVMFCILKDHYVLGACIAAYIHKLFINKLGTGNIDLVIMCDDYIYDKYKNTLEYYFDKVIKIKLRYFKPSDKYNYAKEKYSTWIGYSLNKWQCLKFTEYNKILFLDIDILPNSIKFYTLFNFKTPAVHIRSMPNYICSNSKLIKHVSDTNISFDNYIKNIHNYGSVDGGIVLLEPSMDVYNKYVNFTDNLFKDGIYSSFGSGPDETSIFYYFMSRKIPIYDICVDYLVVPWDDTKYVKYAKSYNFLSFIKPWTKPKFLSWDEEILWRDIYDNMPHGDKLETLFKNTLEESINIYLSHSNKNRKKYYNQDYIKKYPNEVNNIFKAHKRFEKIMKLDEKIKTDGYGILKTDEIINIMQII